MRVQPVKRNVGFWSGLLCLLIAPGAAGHEFWIEAANYQLQPADEIRAHLKVGQNFKGGSQSLIEFRRLALIDNDGESAVKGRMGDYPAIRIRPKRDGLHVLVYESADSSLTYQTVAKFEKFVTREGVQWAVEAHKSRGLPDKDFRERFTRYAKALLKVGDGAGRDRAVGMPFELVALSNPYTDSPGEDILVQVLWQGYPLGSAQVSIYRKPAGQNAQRTTVLTDASGTARIPRGAGGRFLLNAVHLVEPPPNAHRSLVWHSLWASTTYELPESNR